MSVITTGPFDPASSTEINTVDLQRREEVERKQETVAKFLLERGLDALLLRKPENFSWFTCGGDNLSRSNGEPTASLFVSKDARVVVCGNIDSGQLFDREVSCMGFQLKERPWHEAKGILVKDFCRGRKIGSDDGFPETENISDEIAKLRLPLTDYEVWRLKLLSQTVSHAVEATARSLSKGTTEAEAAGEVAHRLMRHEAVPVTVQVQSDGNSKRYRHWGFGADPIEQFCVISAVARKDGLHAGVTRTVCFDNPPGGLFVDHKRACLVGSTGLHFSQANWTVDAIWQRIERIHEKFGFAEEWRQAEQGQAIGYHASEVPIVPNSVEKLRENTPVFWRPAVGAASFGDMVLVKKNQAELLTMASGWPRIELEVKGQSIKCPDILRR